MEKRKGFEPGKNENAIQQRKVEEYISSIETGKKGGPKLDIDNRGKGQIGVLVQNFVSIERSAVPVIRLWNKKQDDIKEVLKQLKSLNEAGVPIAGAVFAINKSNSEGEIQDTMDTRSVIYDVLDGGGPIFPVVPVNIEGYTWTAGLNGPAALIIKALKESGVDLDRVYQLNISADVVFQDDAAKKLGAVVSKGELALMARQDRVIKGDEEAKEMVTQAIEKLHDRTDNDPTRIVSLLRNTGLAVPLNIVEKLQGWDTRCNEWGGMEDVDFAVRALRGLLADKEIGKVKKLLKGTPILYSDRSWDSMPAEGAKAKITREKEALDTISQMLRDENNRITTPREHQDFLYTT